MTMACLGNDPRTSILRAFLTQARCNQYAICTLHVFSGVINVTEVYNVRRSSLLSAFVVVRCR